MGCTIDELVNWLPAASNYKKFEVTKTSSDATTIDFEVDGITITANSLGSRKIALLVIPVLSVVFHFNQKWDKLASEQFMKRFDMYTQRGGG